LELTKPIDAEDPSNVSAFTKKTQNKMQTKQKQKG
jgi:hypothetical protein